MANRTVHPARSVVQVPVPYRLAQQFKAEGYDLDVLIRELLEEFAASSNKIDAHRLKRGNDVS